MRSTIILAIVACLILTVQSFRLKRIDEETLELYS